MNPTRPTAPEGLLGRQLASIADTLARASVRRDEEVRRAWVGARCVSAGGQDDGGGEGGGESGEVREREAAGLHTATPAIPAMRGGAGAVSPVDDDAKGMLAEMRGLEGGNAVEERSGGGELDKGVVKRALAKMEGVASYLRMTPGVDEEGSDDPRRMLAELAVLSASASASGVGGVGRNEKRADDDDDFDALYNRLQELRARSDGKPPSPRTTTDATQLDPKVTPYVIALLLEHSQSHWDYARLWTTHLFGSSPSSHAPQNAQALAVARAEDALNKIIRSVMQEEDDFDCRQVQVSLWRRLIVSNLPTGADIEDVKRPFSKHDIDTITLLPDKNTLRRTQIAYLDMASRKAAVEASYVTGQVYGLVFHVKLAMENGA